MSRAFIATFWLVPVCGCADAASFTPLGFLSGASSSYAYDVTEDGSVVVGNTSSGFRWTADGGMVALSGMNALGVSSDGAVVVGSNGSGEAVRWTAATGHVGLGDLPGGPLSSAAYGVSGDGTAVAGTGRSVSGTEAFRWTTSGGMVGLGDLGGGIFHSQSSAISADGSVVVGFREALKNRS